MGISDRQRRQGVLTITAGERWYANSIARGILSTKRGSEYTLRVLTRYPNDRNVRELERLGAEVVSINYNNVRSLEAALYDTDWLVVVAEDDRNQTRQAAEMARAADRCDVNNIIFMSMEGADNGRTPTQKAYCDMEEIFRDYNESVVIFRPAISQQLFLLWSKAVQEDNVWPWLSNQRGRFVPIHLCDVVESIRCIVCDEEGLMEKLDRRHERKTYRLTGPDSINGNDLIDILNDSVSGGVDLEKVNRRELEEYLRGLRNYAKDTEGRGRGRREPYPEPFLPLSEPQIELIADYFEYVNEGEAGRRSNDVEEITDNKPVPINTFFMDYSDEFKPRDGHRRPGHPGRRPRRGGRRDGRDDYDDHNDRHQRPYNHNINNSIRALVRGSRL